MPLSRYGGIFELADLELLQRVFDQLCNERRLAQKDREQRAALAEEIVGVFQNGTVDERNLLRVLSKRRRA